MPHVGQPGNVLSSAIISGPVTQVFGRDELLGTFLSFFLFQNKTKKKMAGLGKSMEGCSRGL